MSTLIFPFPIAANTILEQRYQISKHLGGSPLGHHYQARDRSLTGGEWLLVEEIPAQFQEQQALRLSLTEISRVLKELRLPLLETFSHSFEENGRSFTLWEDYNWPAIEQMVEANGRLDETSALPLMISVAETFKILLSHGVWICQFSPASVIISPQGKPLLAWAHFRPLSAANPGETEAAASQEVQELGKLLYFILSGARWSRFSPPISEINPKVSKGVENLLEGSLRGLLKDASPGHFAELLRSLHRWEAPSRFVAGAASRIWRLIRPGKKSA